MIMDYELEFSDNQTVTVSAPSTNVVDLVKPGDAGEELYLNILVDEAVEASGAATVDFALQTDDNVEFSSAKQLWASGAIAKGILIAGYYVAKFRMPKGVEQHSQLYMTVASGPLTAGKFSAWLSMDIDHDNT